MNSVAWFRLFIFLLYFLNQVETLKMTALQDSRQRINALKIAVEHSPALRAALIPYPDPVNVDIIAAAFGIKRKVCAGKEHLLFSMSLVVPTRELQRIHRS